MVDLRAETLRLLKKYGVRPRRRLGQSFMVDQLAAERIAGYLGLRGYESVMDVGAGLGALTRVVAERTGGVVVAVEVDRRLVVPLAEAVRGYCNVDVVRADVLRMAFPRVSHVVSNVPYSISSPFLLKLAREEGWEVAVLTFQLEFARRIVARAGTGEYGRLSVIAQLCFSVEFLEVLPPHAFWPRPKVYSAVIRLRPQRRIDAGEVLDFGRFTAVLFSQRRRRVEKVLRRVGVEVGELGELASKRVYQLEPLEVLSLYRRVWPSSRVGRVAA